VDWNSPARLLDKIIEHEAVHQIDGWDDLRRRLEPDRRCFAFFHPALPGEPLIFVEVALLDEMPDAIAPLLDRSPSALAGGDRFTVAAFYSISNCQPGLRGVNLGNFLIKQVAEQLRQQFPRLRTFCTLSPVPSLADWIARAGALAPGAATDAVDPEVARRLCAQYLLKTSSGEAGGADPVARFHLNNGARLERVNVSADLSRKGLRQSHGVMVNYLYDLDHIEANHERFVNGEVVASRAVRALA